MPVPTLQHIHHHVVVVALELRGLVPLVPKGFDASIPAGVLDKVDEFVDEQGCQCILDCCSCDAPDLAPACDVLLSTPQFLLLTRWSVSLAYVL